MDKTLYAPITMEGTLKEPTNVIDPVITITTSNPESYNYMHIPSFNRYYFINSVENVRNGLWKITAHVDVLSTYKDEVKRLFAIVDKQAEIGDTNFNDGSYNVKESTFTEVKNYPNGFNDTGEFILMTAGLQIRN